VQGYFEGGSGKYQSEHAREQKVAIIFDAGMEK